MSEIGLRTRMLVKDVMSSPVITVDENEPVDRVAQLMETQKLGCIIVTEKTGRPIGIITERDLVTRVLAKNKLPSKLVSKDVMTSPLITINPEETLSNTARHMSRLNVRRLGVVYKGDLVGIISSKDVLAITPELIDTIQEKARIESGNMEELVESSLSAGYCDRCGQWSSQLKDVEGEFLCEECAER
ncbi:MAG: CBS domain-containing protein [Candidatus Bathyarchaeota archaeon]|nr:MAG: CBS domain-containing protein [Candidatus Bathyarchaeota archaeon]